VDLSFKTWGGRLFYAGMTATCIVALAFLLRSDDALTVAFLVWMWLAFSLVMFGVLSYAHFTFEWFIPRYLRRSWPSRREVVVQALGATVWSALYVWLSPRWSHQPVKLGWCIFMWFWTFGVPLLFKPPERLGLTRSSSS
jgi:hypothetical protein